MSFHISCKRYSSITYDQVLIELYTVGVYDLRISIRRIIKVGTILREMISSVRQGVTFCFN